MDGNKQSLRAVGALILYTSLFLTAVCAFFWMAAMDSEGPLYTLLDFFPLIALVPTAGLVTGAIILIASYSDR